MSFSSSYLTGYLRENSDSNEALVYTSGSGKASGNGSGKDDNGSGSGSGKASGSGSGKDDNGSGSGSGKASGSGSGKDDNGSGSGSGKASGNGSGKDDNGSGSGSGKASGSGSGKDDNGSGSGSGKASGSGSGKDDNGSGSGSGKASGSGSGKDDNGSGSGSGKASGSGSGKDDNGSGSGSGKASGSGSGKDDNGSGSGSGKASGSGSGKDDNGSGSGSGKASGSGSGKDDNGSGSGSGKASGSGSGKDDNGSGSGSGKASGSGSGKDDNGSGSGSGKASGSGSGKDDNGSGSGSGKASGSGSGKDDNGSGSGSGKASGSGSGHDDDDAETGTIAGTVFCDLDCNGENGEIKFMHASGSGKASGSGSGKDDKGSGSGSGKASGSGSGKDDNGSGKASGSGSGHDDDDAVYTPEPTKVGVVIKLLDLSGNVAALTSTDAHGNYKFDKVPVGDYKIMGVAPDGTEFTIKDAGSDDSIDSDVDKNGLSDVIHVTAKSKIDVDLGVCEKPDVGSVSGLYFCDENGNNIFDEEKGIANRSVTLEGAGDDGIFGTSDDIQLTTTTAEDGTYAFEDLDAGEYKVSINGAGFVTGFDVDENGMSSIIALGAGDNIDLLAASECLELSGTDLLGVAEVLAGAENIAGFGFPNDAGRGEIFYDEADGSITGDIKITSLELGDGTFVEYTDLDGPLLRFDLAVNRDGNILPSGKSDDLLAYDDVNGNRLFDDGDLVLLSATALASGFVESGDMDFIFEVNGGTLSENFDPLIGMTMDNNPLFVEGNRATTVSLDEDFTGRPKGFVGDLDYDCFCFMADSDMNFV